MSSTKQFHVDRDSPGHIEPDTGLGVSFHLDHRTLCEATTLAGERCMVTTRERNGRCRHHQGSSPRAIRYEGFVYVVRGAGLSKIGFAMDVCKRVRDLQTGSPVQLEAVLAAPAYRHEEGDLHIAFAEKRRHGEWFALDDADLLVLAMMLGERHRDTIAQRFADWDTHDAAFLSARA